MNKRAKAHEGEDQIIDLSSWEVWTRDGNGGRVKSIFQAEETVVLFVKDGHSYGTAKSGQRVRVPAEELDNPSSMKCLITEDAKKQLLDAKARKALEKSKPVRSALKDIVEAQLDRISDEAIRAKKSKEAKQQAV